MQYNNNINARDVLHISHRIIFVVWCSIVLVAVLDRVLYFEIIFSVFSDTKYL
jgi:hypothetical protein